ncbi:ABC transporter substrate-binding protein [Oceanospirillum sediminis]|uniref:Putrescine-binding periplasmic protein n=1 Tax=Oceanospirillum sediminis TaxID=2760088 RepID=A0A839ING3_9GAMM|nr:extracellular solute-binding protein [Oceanospirillum sediminis]MBB1486234.1 extracellular solute-binding protein [Oceanospirillum sediminis]
MKKLLVAGLALASNLALAQEKVVVYNWSEYIDESVVEQFTKETGIEVEYATFDSNEVMYSKLKLQKGKGYDIAVPSTYYVSKMAREGMLQPIDKTKLSHFGNLNVDLLDKDYDKGNQYSVPYFWGSTAISYDADTLSEGEITSWKDLWDPKWKGQLLLTDDIREVFHMALTLNGHSGNSKNPEEIKQAYETLKSLMPNVLVFNSEAPREPFLSGDVSLGMNWNGEVYMAQQEGANLKYVYPKEGAVFWVDSFVIPSGAANIDNAHKFIDFMLRAEVAKTNAEYVGYASPNSAALPLMDEDVRKNPAVFPSQDDIARGEFHHDIGDDAMKLMTEYWQKLKAGM